MKRKASLLVVAVLSLLAGLWIGRDLAPSDDGAERPGSAGEGEPDILYWVAPMDPNYRRDGPGQSPMGMDLVPVYADQAPAGEAVTIAPEVVQNLGVRTALAERGPLRRSIRAPGHVAFDGATLAHVHLRTSGWIEGLTVAAEGDAVREGQILFRLYSPQLIAAQKEYLQARRRGQQALVAGAEEKLVVLGMTAAQIEDLGRRGAVLERLSVLAPRDGVVAALEVRENMFVEPALMVMEIADLSRVWVHARLFEAQAAWVRVGHPAELLFDALPGRSFQGRIDYVYPVLDAHTRTHRVRVELDNPEGELRPGMYASLIIDGGARREVLRVPRDALIRSGESDRVVVDLGAGRFEVREVIAGVESDQQVEIRRGLREGERIVVSAQFLIDSEASMSGSIRRLTPVDGERESGHD